MMQPQRVTGREGDWARELALIGGTTSLVAPAMAIPLMVSPWFALVAGLVGAVSGAMLGATMPTVLDAMRQRVPPGLLLLGFGPVVGAMWGASVGGIAATLVPGHPLELAVASAAIAGALQLGLCWLPYTMLTVLQKRRWPAIVTAIVGTPVVGLLTIVAVISLFA
jgi:hypothetical protein